MPVSHRACSTPSCCGAAGAQGLHARVSHWASRCLIRHVASTTGPHHGQKSGEELCSCNVDVYKDGHKCGRGLHSWRAQGHVGSYLLNHPCPPPLLMTCSKAQLCCQAVTVGTHGTELCDVPCYSAVIVHPADQSSAAVTAYVCAVEARIKITIDFLTREWWQLCISIFMAEVR